MRHLREKRGALSLRAVGFFFGTTLCFTGCVLFQNRPALPKHAQGDGANGQVAAEADFTAGAVAADVIYLCGTTSETEAARRFAPRLIETLLRTGEPVAIGWDELEVTQQPLCDELREGQIGSDEFAARLAWPLSRSGLAANRDLLLQTLRMPVAQVALACPREILTKIRRGEPLSESERGIVPTEFVSRPGDFAEFADRASGISKLRRSNLDALYRTYVVARQTTAQNIIQYFAAHPRGKMVVFLRTDSLTDPRDVARYVTQKTRLRQMILDRSGVPPSTRPNLLTLLRSGRGGWLLKIVDGTPFAFSHA
jgi:uncharacterized iron-regulated protein